MPIVSSPRLTKSLTSASRRAPVVEERRRGFGRLIVASPVQGIIPVSHFGPTAFSRTPMRFALLSWDNRSLSASTPDRRSSPGSGLVSRPNAIGQELPPKSACGIERLAIRSLPLAERLSRVTKCWNKSIDTAFLSHERRQTMEQNSHSIEKPSRRAPWNKGKIVGAKPPLRPSHVCQSGRNYKWRLASGFSLCSTSR